MYSTNHMTKGIYSVIVCITDKKLQSHLCYNALLSYIDCSVIAFSIKSFIQCRSREWFIFKVLAEGEVSHSDPLSCLFHCHCHPHLRHHEVPKKRLRRKYKILLMYALNFMYQQLSLDYSASILAIQWNHYTWKQNLLFSWTNSAQMAENVK